ncbi:MAG: TatD family hydrolase [Halobacteriota archaeon]
MSFAVDAHCHIDMAQFDSDRKDVITRAKNAHVTIINSGIDLNSNFATKRLLMNENVCATYGLSPIETNQADKVEDFIRQNTDTAIGIGEVGLDYYHVGDTVQRERQKAAFKRFIDLSDELGLTLIVHSRDAERHVFEMTNRLDNVIYHCYSGDLDTLHKIVDCGHYISISTRVKKSKIHQEMVRCTPQELIIVETDSPYLSPRKGRNEPAYIIEAIATIAEIWATTVNEAASIILDNTVNAFKQKLKTT